MSDERSSRWEAYSALDLVAAGGREGVCRLLLRPVEGDAVRARRALEAVCDPEVAEGLHAGGRVGVA